MNPRTLSPLLQSQGMKAPHRLNHLMSEGKASTIVLPRRQALLPGRPILTAGDLYMPTANRFLPQVDLSMHRKTEDYNP